MHIDLWGATQEVRPGGWKGSWARRSSFQPHYGAALDLGQPLNKWKLDQRAEPD